jgi:putative component of membrane protein insertase Oxa1/YidC/SpoIIIJ protein YidD
MSPLRKCLKHPGTYLVLLVCAVLCIVGDSFRDPAHQRGAQAYIALVHAYQHSGRPLLEGYVRCRYIPTCSRYSIAAVQKYGLRKGLALTGNRLWRCRGSVPLNTPDPLP